MDGSLAFSIIDTIIYVLLVLIVLLLLGLWLDSRPKRK